MTPELAIRWVQSRFTGKEHDSESGNDYFGARYYASSMGRFLSPDPSQLVYADQANPQSLNLYAYALNNPLKFIDPTGMYCDYSDHDDPSSGFDSSQFDYHSNSGECSQNGGQWVDDAYTHNGADDDGRPEEAVAALGNSGPAPNVPTQTPTLNLQLGYFYNFGTFVGPMTVQNLKSGFFNTEQGRFNACLASLFGAGAVPNQNQADSPAVDPSKSGAALGATIHMGPVAGLNAPFAGSHGTIYVASGDWDTGGANQVNANYGTFAHETGNILDARKNGQNGNYERNYGNPNDPVDTDTGAAVERCMFGTLQYP